MHKDRKEREFQARVDAMALKMYLPKATFMPEIP